LRGRAGRRQRIDKKKRALEAEEDLFQGEAVGAHEYDTSRIEKGASVLKRQQRTRAARRDSSSHLALFKALPRISTRGRKTSKARRGMRRILAGGRCRKTTFMGTGTEKKNERSGNKRKRPSARDRTETSMRVAKTSARDKASGSFGSGERAIAPGSMLLGQRDNRRQVSSRGGGIYQKRTEGGSEAFGAACSEEGKLGGSKKGGGGGCSKVQRRGRLYV